MSKNLLGIPIKWALMGKPTGYQYKQGRSHVPPWGGRGPCKKKEKKKERSTSLYKKFNWPPQ